MGEFLRLFRATSLLAKLEDDEELPVGDNVEENEEDCDDSEDFEVNYDEEGLYSKADKMRRVWEPTGKLKKTYRGMKPLCHFQGETLRCHSFLSLPAQAAPWTRCCS